MLAIVRQRDACGRLARHVLAARAAEAELVAELTDVSQLPPPTNNKTGHSNTATRVRRRMLSSPVPLPGVGRPRPS